MSSSRNFNYKLKATGRTNLKALVPMQNIKQLQLINNTDIHFKTLRHID